MPHRSNRDAATEPRLSPPGDLNNFFRRVLAPNPYSNHPPAPPIYSTRIHPPPSPPRETGGKPSLPSISSLLNHEEDGKPRAAEAAPCSNQPIRKLAVDSEPTPPSSCASRKGPPQNTSCFTSDIRYDGVYKYPSHPASVQNTSNTTAMLPPTPPLNPERAVSRDRSYSNSSQQSFLSQAPYQLGSSINNIDPHQQRVASAQQLKRYSMPLPPTVSPYLISPYAASSPGGFSVVSSFYSPASDLRASYSPYDRRSLTSSYGTPAADSKSSFPLHEQKPLPCNFPPANLVSLSTQSHPSPSGSTTSNPTEHHHYIGNSSHASFHQTQERYVCPTCKKAFSRPSSLRIHSHSHTGEKPFKCPHSGCGKTFSVRSNMKRHERGCHARPGQIRTTETATSAASG